MDAHLRDLRYFVAVAEELSFTRAAERLHISQPALSKQIRSLESTLRAQLLVRDRRRVGLTSAGVALLDVARRLLADWDTGMAAVSDAAAADARVLRVGTLTAIGHALYPRALAQFAAARPDWRVELASFGWGDPTAGLSDRATDAAFVWLPVDDPDLACEVLVTEPRFVALGAGHPLAARPSVDIGQLADDPFVALPRSAGASRDFWLAIDERAGRPPRVAAEVTTADEAFEQIAAGAAVSLLAEGMAAVYSRPGIVCLPVTDVAPARLAVAWRQDDRRPAVQAFVDACRSAADTELS
jgi:DNA-binding transcriptional LysR family regulator